MSHHWKPLGRFELEVKKEPAWESTVADYMLLLVVAATVFLGVILAPRVL